MATRELAVITCSTCSNPSEAICVACQRYYCGEHFNDHRKMLNNVVNDARPQASIIVQCLDEYQQIEDDLRNKIKEWEQKTTDQVHQTATKLNIELTKTIEIYRDNFTVNSTNILEDTRKSHQIQVIQIEKLKHHYEKTLKKIKLFSHHNQKPTLDIQIIDPESENTTLTDTVLDEPSQPGMFVPQTSLGKRLIEKPFAQIPIGNFWAIGGSDTQLLVQEYERKQLILFDRNGKKHISITWHFEEAIRDIQWHDQSHRFFILLDKELKILDPNDISYDKIEPIKPYQSNRFRRCACFDDHLFISYFNVESTLELYDTRSWQIKKQWISPITCHANELITCIRMNSNQQLGMSIEDNNNPINRKFRFEIRDLNLNTLHTTSLQTDTGIFSRMTSLSDGPWALVNVDNHFIFIINQNGNFIEKIEINQEKLHNIALIGKDTLVIRTHDKLLFY